ncbi:MAG: cysteine--tRNA ligase [Halanaerobiales bacterium]
MLKVYNTLTKKKEGFNTIKKDKVMMYVCGLTVQNYSHLGHIRSAINYDVIRRYLEYKGYDVTYIQNFTDINEKIVARAKEEEMSPEELAEKYTRAYLEDIDRLNVKRASKYVKATENIDAIIDMIERLVDRGYAYEAGGNVYFSVDKFEDYGKLSGRKLEDMQAGSRITVVEEKRNPMDFALWKKAPEGEKEWDSPWGKGWPGWHIECSAMSTKYLGDSFDIHGGGSDLIFPHHENEIAQSEACTGKEPFAKYWLHNGSVNLKGEKMSKSLGNFFTTRELLKKFRGAEIRYFLLSKHYRSPIDFTIEELENSRTSLKRIINIINNMERIMNSEIEKDEKISSLDEHQITNQITARKKAFVESMNDDFNTARAIGVLHEFITDINKVINNQDFLITEDSILLVKETYRQLDEFMDILGLNVSGEEEQYAGTETVNQLIELMLDVREEARNKKDWGVADMIRDGLNDLGFEIKDTPQGVVWEKHDCI